MNNFQTMVDNAMLAERQKKLSTSPQLTLGELILKLESVKNKELPLFIDINEKRPMGINSWRGSYCELSIQTEDFGSYNTDEVEWKSDDGDYTSYKMEEIGKENPTVAEWINVLKTAIGKEFVGYKGGDFLMSKNTPVWLSEYGSSCFKQKNSDEYENTYFIDIKEEKEKVYLITKAEAY